MDVERYFADCTAQWPSFGAPESLSRAARPADGRLSPITAAIKGMSTENNLMLLNLAVKNIRPGEVYVEVGSWRGLTLCGALHGNPDVPAFACDNFSQFGGPREEFFANVARFTPPGQVRFHDMDFHRFFQLAPWAPARVGAFFYDGGHTFEEQYLALDYILPWLADDAIVIVDDTNMPQVRAANALFARQVPSLELVKDIRTPANGSPTWWDGIQIFRHRPNGVHAAPRGLAYDAGRMFWDDVFPPTKTVLHKIRKRMARRIPALRKATD